MKKVCAFAICLVFYECDYNYQGIDFTYSYNYAQIAMPDDSVVEGKVQSWRDYEDGDQIQVTINNVTYLTDTTRCVLIKVKNF